MITKKQAVTLGLSLASVTIFGVVAIANQSTDTSKQATASTNDFPEATTSQIASNSVVKEQQDERQKEKIYSKKQETAQRIFEEQQALEQEQQAIVLAQEQERQEQAFQEQQALAQEQYLKEQSVAETPAESQSAATSQAIEEVVQTPAAEVMHSPSATLTIAGSVIPYQNGGSNGQAIIDANRNGTASTFGGAAVQSGTDNMNTHFIGHNPGIFSAVLQLSTGSQVIVTDANGSPTTYTVTTVLDVDDYGFGLYDNVDYYDTILGTGGGERITLQTCISDTTNRIVIAQA